MHSTSVSATKSISTIKTKTLMLVMKLVSEMLVSCNHLMQVSSREDYVYSPCCKLKNVEFLLLLLIFIKPTDIVL
jgi:hypothetical protein